MVSINEQQACGERGFQNFLATFHRQIRSDRKYSEEFKGRGMKWLEEAHGRSEDIPITGRATRS